MSDAALAQEELPETAPPSEAGDDPPEKTAEAPPDKPAKKSAATPPKDKAPSEGPSSYWPDDWREKAAEHISAGDKKIYDRELKRLSRITDPAGMYGMYRELEGKFSEGGLTKIPGPDASDDDRAAFWRQLGVPEKPEDYFDGLKLANDAVLGDLDKPVAEAHTTPSGLLARR